MQKEIKIKKEFKELIPALSDEEYAQLEKNIIQDGCRDALVVWNNYLVDGHNRIKICNEHNISYTIKEIELENETAAKEWIILNQFGRRNLKTYQRAELALKYEKLYSKIAKERMIKGVKQPFPDSGKGMHVDEMLSKIANVSKDTIHKVRNIKKKAPEKLEELSSGKTSIDKAFKEIKQKERKKEIKKLQKEINEGKAKLPKGVFEVIVVDPPWKYASDEHYNPDGRRVASPYPTMSMEDIEKLKIPAAKDSICFLWATNTYLHEAFHILNKWGFEYKTCLTWDKVNMGTGHWLRGQTEHVLIGIKGKPIFNGKSTPTIFSEKRRQHSRKPEKFYEIVEEITIGRKLDYFSREHRKGWATFGIEISKFGGKK